MFYIKFQLVFKKDLRNFNCPMVKFFGLQCVYMCVFIYIYIYIYIIDGYSKIEIVL